MRAPRQCPRGADPEWWAIGIDTRPMRGVEKPHIWKAGDWRCGYLATYREGDTPAGAYAARMGSQVMVYFSATPNPKDWTPTDGGVIPSFP